MSFSWLVFELTGSPEMLGLANFMRGIPFLVFGPMGGIAADRLERRSVMMMSQTAGSLLALSLAILVLTGNIQVWHLILAAFLGGVSNSFHQPARQTMVPNLVDRPSLLNAYALMSSGFNASRLLAPVLAGVLLGSVGVAAVFLIQALLNIAALMFTMPLPSVRKIDATRSFSLIGDVLDGMRYVKNNGLVAALLLQPLAIQFFGIPINTVMPIFAKDILQAGPSGLGLLTASQGVGALTALLCLAAVGNVSRKGLVIILTTVIYGCAYLVFANSQLLLPSMLILVVAGALHSTSLTLANTMLQTVITDELRGRVTSIQMLDRGITPFGGLSYGLLAGALGAPGSVMVMASIMMAYTGVVATRFGSLRRLN